jgi:transcriptional regulator
MGESVMFVPVGYRPDHAAWARAIVRRHPLALLVTNGEAGPYATHLPVVPDGDALESGTGATGLVGVGLRGHLDRRNPHWAALAAGQPGVLVFQGPDAYVSPTAYRTSPAAPTWNFVTVHLHGTPEPVDSREETLEVVRATVQAFERDHGTGWDMTDSAGYFAEIVGGVGAFRFRVTAAEGMFKLSQEKPAGTRAAVADALAEGPERARCVAAAMRDLGVVQARAPAARGPGQG